MNVQLLSQISSVVRAKPYANSNIDKSLYILKFTDFNPKERWIIYPGKRKGLQQKEFAERNACPPSFLTALRRINNEM